jgi:heat-inducible transcriptional repressor
MSSTLFKELDSRSRAIFETIVTSYMHTGEPVGSRTLSRIAGLDLSPATIRNVMADLEELGLVLSPHKSAGRLPSQTGLRFYVDGLMELGALTKEERDSIKAECSANGRSMREMYEQATTTLSGLSQCTGLVVAPKANKPLKQVQFVPLGIGRVLVVMVSQDGMVENRVLETSLDTPATALITATNYLNHHIAGKTLDEVRGTISEEIESQKAQLDNMTATLVKQGLAMKTGDDDMHLIVRGQRNLLNNITAMEDLEKVRKLFAALEEKESMMRILQQTQNAQGVQIFIGTENDAFSHDGLSMIISPYKNTEEKVIGAIGVIGPTRLNYGRLIPIVDYTAQIMTKLMG